MRAFYGMEAIDFQSVELHQGLTNIIREWRVSKDYNEGNSHAQAISAIISEKTGISTNIEVSQVPVPNAYVEVPQLDKNNPILSRMQRALFNTSDMRKLTKIIGDTVNSTLDFKKGKVYGDLTKLVIPVYITTGILNDSDFIDEEVAAIVCHELGHIWSLFESLVDVVSVNVAAHTVANRLMGLNTPQARVALIMETSKELDVDAKLLETIAEETSKEVIYTHIVSTTLKERRNAEGDETYSYRGFEFSADQYAVRMGGGKYLASALARIEKKAFLGTTYRSWPGHIFLEVMSVVIKFSLSIMSPIYGIGFAIYLLVARPMDKIYDDPKERLERIRREMISQLKTDISPAERRAIVKDLSAVEDVYSRMSPKTPWLEAVWKYVIPTGRKQQASMEFQQSLERLANNELFVTAAKLEG